MVGASKILTVSYGTFSCTLEGFDDSFTTMKAIAEYFRDLAAEDRYFGAEPPEPDAEMLARIAEKEVSRRVEARIKDNNVVLRQQEAPALEPQRAAPSPIPPQQVSRPASAEPARKPAFQPQPAAAAAAAPAAGAADTDSIAAKLQRIRAVVAQNRSGASDRLFDEDEQVGEIAEELDSPARKAAAKPAPKPVLNDPELIAAASEEAEPEAGEEEDSLAALEAFEQAEEPAAALEEAAAEEASVDAPAAAELDAYEEDGFEEAAFAQAPAVEETPAVSEAAEEEFEAEADFAPEATDALLKAVASRAAASEVEAVAEDVAVAPALEEAEETVAEDSEADLLPEEAVTLAETVEFEVEAEEVIEAESAEDAAIEAPEAEAVAEEMPEAEAFEAEAAEEDEDAAVLARLSGTLATDAAAEDAPEAELAAETEASEAPAETAEDDAEGDTEAAPLVLTAENSVTTEEAPAAEDAAEEPAKERAASAAAAAAARARARVIRMKKADVEEAIADGTLLPVDLVEEEDSAEASADEPAQEAAASSLSQAEEEDLRAELAAVEAGERGEAGVRPVRPVRVTPRRVTTEAQDEEDAVARLLEQTNSKMEESEGARRRSGFAHLKAAVAATVADRKFLGGRKKQDDASEDAYREDLAKAVTPAPAERPSRKAGTMAPLMLVSEQRVDVSADGRKVAARAGDAMEGDATAGNLALQQSPRREVSVYELEKVDHVLADDTSFADFAARLGVSELPDLLEAAAAYVAYVEGRPQFSRPHVMGLMAKADTAGEFTREDGLRSFGQLLREGRLQKVQRGQFTVSKTTRFKPKARYGNE